MDNIIVRCGLPNEKKWKHPLMPSCLQCKDKGLAQSAQKQLTTQQCSHHSFHLMRQNHHTLSNLVTRDQAMTGMAARPDELSDSSQGERKAGETKDGQLLS